MVYSFLNNFFQLAQGFYTQVWTRWSTNIISVDIFGPKNRDDENAMADATNREPRFLHYWETVKSGRNKETIDPLSGQLDLFAELDRSA